MSMDFKHGDIVEISDNNRYWRAKYFYIFYCPEDKLHYVDPMYGNVRCGGTRPVKHVRILPKNSPAYNRYQWIMDQ